MKSLASKNLTPYPVENMIQIVRKQRVMLDRDLAEIYGVQTKVLNQAVRRNSERFPSDFMFQLTEEESESLRSQFVTLEKGRGKYSKYSAYAFTEHGVAMLSSVLRSPRAVQMNILIMRTFIRMRELVTTHNDLKIRIEKLEHSQHTTDAVIETLVDDIEKVNRDVNWIKNPPVEKKRRIGYL